MKPNLLLALVPLFFCSLPVWAQSSIEGTWELERISTTSPEGKKTSVDKLVIKALLVITPTHFAEVARTVQGDSSIFRSASYGSYNLEGNKIKLTSLVNSNPEFTNRTFDVTFRVNGKQATFVTVLEDPAGRRSITEQVVRKVDLSAQLNGEVLGTWNVITGKTTSDYENKSFDPSKQQTIQVITPTHLVTVYSRDQRFSNMVVFPITKKGDIVQLDMEHRISSLSWQRVAGFASSQFTSKLEAGKHRINWTNVSADGKVVKRDELMERVGTQKAMANK